MMAVIRSAVIALPTLIGIVTAPVGAQNGPTLTVTAASPTTVVLTWTAPAIATRYWVRRAIGSAPLANLSTPKLTGTSYSDDAAPAGTGLKYQIMAKLTSGAYSYSGVVNVTTPASAGAAGSVAATTPTTGGAPPQTGGTTPRVSGVISPGQPITNVAMAPRDRQFVAVPTQAAAPAAAPVAGTTLSTQPMTTSAPLAPTVNPTGFTATHEGGGTVRLAWNAMNGATSYWVGGPGLPFQKTTDTTMSVANVPAGAQTYSVTSQYINPQGQPYADELHPTTATVTVPVARGSYRVVLTGFTVNSPTWDNALNGDGWGDEAFAVAAVDELDASGAVVKSWPIMKSKTYGDVNGHPGWMKAGHLTDRGGLGAGDQVPATGATVDQGPAGVDYFPMVLWQGELVDGQGAIAIKPSVWEWDGGGNLYQAMVNVVRQGTATLQGSQLFQGLIGSQGQLVVTSVDLGLGLIQTLTDKDLIGQAKDRPIGSTAAGFNQKIVLLNRGLADGILQTQQGLIQVPYADDPKYRGNYTMYLRVERCANAQCL